MWDTRRPTPAYPVAEAQLNDTSRPWGSDPRAVNATMRSRPGSWTAANDNASGLARGSQALLALLHSSCR